MSPPLRSRSDSAKGDGESFASGTFSQGPEYGGYFGFDGGETFRGLSKSTGKSRVFEPSRIALPRPPGLIVSAQIASMPSCQGLEGPDNAGPRGPNSCPHRSRRPRGQGLSVAPRTRPGLVDRPEPPIASSAARIEVGLASSGDRLDDPVEVGDRAGHLGPKIDEALRRIGPRSTSRPRCHASANLDLARPRARFAQASWPEGMPGRLFATGSAW